MKTFNKSEDIRVGVVGYGGAFNMGKAHLSQVAANGMQPAAVVEMDAARLEVARADFPGIKTFSSLAMALEADAVDLVTLITPHNTHAELAQQCLDAGKHVVVEKPLAITLHECDRMIGTAHDKGLLLSTYHNRHWDGCILEAVDRIRNQGVIGEIVRVEAHMGRFDQPLDWWRSSKSISGGIHYDWGVHLLEYTFQLVDSRVLEVSGFSWDGVWKTKWGEDTIEDEVSAIVRFESGALLNLRITQLDADPSAGQLKIVGTRGTYRFTQRDYEIYRFDGKTQTIERGQNRPGEQEKYYANIAATLTSQADLIITPEWSRRPIEVLWLATESARQGRALRPS